MDETDLNLLFALDALLAEGSVAGAARRLRLSASATSRTLARLRAVTQLTAGCDRVCGKHATGRRASPFPSFDELGPQSQWASTLAGLRRVKGAGPQLLCTIGVRGQGLHTPSSEYSVLTIFVAEAEIDAAIGLLPAAAGRPQQSVLGPWSLGLVRPDSLVARCPR